MHRRFETDFARSLLGPLPPSRLPWPSKRFAIYRNNVFVSLVDALKARFPTVRSALGADFFDALARDYAGTHPPTSPVMMAYGDGFPSFIDAFPPLVDLPWIGDLARVDAAVTESFHAADAEPLGRDALHGVAPERLADLRLTLHPALRVVPSSFPIVTLWRMAGGQTAIAPLDEAPAETALIHRPRFSVSVSTLSPAGGIFLTRLGAGRPLGDAVDAALARDPGFDLATHLHRLIAEGLTMALLLSPTDRTVP